MEPILMSAGVFSRRSRLSAKALRIYEEKGLLTPWTIDRGNGYRYYAESQLEQARLIGLLRSLDMPLKQIAEVVTMDPELAIKEIGIYWQSVEADLETKRQLVRYLDRFLVGKGKKMFDVKTRDRTAQKVASIEKHQTAPDLPNFIGNSMERLHSLLKTHGLEAGTPLVIYRGEVNTDADGPVEVCVPFEGSLEPTEDIRIRIEPAGKEAYVRISKAQVKFPGILDAYEAVDKWISESDVDHDGPPREIYFTDWEAATEDDLAVDIAFPIRSR